MPDVQFHFTEEQCPFRDVLRRCMAAASPTTEARRLMDDERGFDPAIWRRMSDELHGGTDEIQRNIIAERVLGMPKAPRFDKGPFRDVATNTSRD